MDASELDEAISLLRRTPVLSACHDEVLTRRQLTERVDLSRTTAYRATVALEERGLLTNTDEGYRTTARGAALVAASDSFLTAIETVDRLEPLLELVSHPKLTDHAHLFADAQVVVADASNPYRVVERSIERLDETSRSRGTLASTTAVEAMEQAIPSIEDKEFIERIFTESALDAHDTVGGERFREATQSDVLSVLVADDDAIPFSFAIDDEGVSIVGHDPATGLPTVHVESDRPAARAWLERVYERCRGEANAI